jgi:DNA-binding NtrC family response regulator
VITDMMMPQMDGPALIAALRELDPQLRIIASSGLGTDTQMHEASGRGASHFLAKPFTARVLLDTVRSALATV